MSLPLGTQLTSIVLVVLCAAVSAQSASPPAKGVPSPSESPLKREPIKPIPAGPSLHAAKVVLGKLLFHDPRLSRDNTVSCASCHGLTTGGCDQRARSRGVSKVEGRINAPTVFNSSLNFKQFWNGRAKTLEEQVDGPLHSADEMGTNWPEVIGKLRAQPAYGTSFGAIYADGIQPQNVRDAIAEFERSLTTPNSRFDKYLLGDATALTDGEKEGYRKFKAYGCTSCHQGVNVGGNMFETLGVMADYFGERGHMTAADFGRFTVTGKEEDRFVFKVPSLRNIALTAPYFHDGSAASLEEAVATMGKYQLGQELPAQDVTQLVEFLKTLTGEFEGRPL